MKREFDTREPTDSVEISQRDEERKSLSAKGRQAVQGEDSGRGGESAHLDDTPRPQDGHEFERWANRRYFGGHGRRLNVDPAYNCHLDKQVASGLSLLSERRSDLYDEKHAEIWEMKSGYEKGGIKVSQLEDYQTVLDAGYVYEKMGDEKPQRREVKAVHYLFATKAGAERNAGQFIDHDIGVWYVDNANNIQYLDRDQA